MGIVSNYEVRKLKFRKPRGILGGLFQFAKFTGEKQRLQSKMGSSETAISKMQDMIRNTILRAVNTIPGCSAAENDLWNLRGIEKLYNLEIDLKDLQEGGGNLEVKKNVADFE